MTKAERFRYAAERKHPQKARAARPKTTRNVTAHENAHRQKAGVPLKAKQLLRTLAPHSQHERGR